MKKLVVMLLLVCIAFQGYAEIVEAQVSSRHARQLRLAARQSLRAKRVTPPRSFDLGSVCSNTVLLSGNQLHKSEGSGHLAKDARGKSCAWVYGSGNYTFTKASSYKFLDSAGNQLSAFRVYERGGCPYPFRAYTKTNGPTCQQIAAQALANTGNMEGYIVIGGGTCYKINSIIGRQGGDRFGKITSDKRDCRAKKKKA